MLEQTLAQVVTGANGEWSVPVAIAAGRGEGISLRALCSLSASAPVAVSAPLHVPGAAAITPASAPAPTPEAAAPPAT